MQGVSRRGVLSGSGAVAAAPAIPASDCSPQRNVSKQGRRRRTGVGARLRHNGVAWASVESSRWCRCLETARLAFGAAEPLPLLDSSFAGRPDATPELRRHLLALPRTEANRIYVTHMVNVMRLLGINASDAEIVAARIDRDALQTIGTLRPEI